jgi:uncharacterized C2H2 Zn-finger protein
MSGKHPGNQHKAHDCPYCWRVLYSKGALTNHINNEHWWLLDEEAEEGVELELELADEPA